jgi:hypothetical protein
MDGAGLDVKGMAAAHDLDVERAARVTDLHFDPPLLDVDDLVLRAVELEAELPVLSDEEDLAAVAVCKGVDDLVAPGLFDAAYSHPEAVEVEQVR